MAKKGQAVQLQQELNFDEDWDKMMHRDGLIVVDIYSEWCGPCSAMLANLKKLKLEVGGDNLHLAVAKSDTISYLERFRNKSEPTWMFIVNVKMVNLMFGANAPKLVRLIINELQNEAEAKKGNCKRTFIEISELAPEEQVRYDAAKLIEDEVARIEKEKAEQVLRDKRLAVANCVLEHYGNAGVVLVFPQCTKQGQSTLAEFWGPAGLTVTVTEKCQLTEEMIDEMLYFTERDKEFSKADIYNLTNAPGLAYLIKPHIPDDYSNDIDSAVLEIVYGSSKCPPGDPETPAQRLLSRLTKSELQAKLSGNTKSSLQSKLAQKKKGDEEEKKDEEEEIVELSGLWAPPNANAKAIAIKWLFPKQYDPIALPQPPAVPPHVAVIYEAFKRREILDLVNEYRSEVIRYGFFTEESPETTKLIAKTLPLFEKAIATIGTTFGEKLIVQLAKTHPEPLKAFTDLGPTYLSKNSVEGEHECKLFFPENYDEPEGGRGEVERKKKRRKGRKAKEATVLSQENLVEDEHGPTDETAANEEEVEGEHVEGEGESDGEGDGEGELQIDEDNVGEGEEALPEGTDKATSPMPP